MDFFFKDERAFLEPAKPALWVADDSGAFLGDVVGADWQGCGVTPTAKGQTLPFIVPQFVWKFAWLFSKSFKVSGRGL